MLESKMDRIKNAEIKENRLILLVLITLSGFSTFLFIFCFNKSIILLFLLGFVTFLSALFAFQRFRILKKQDFPLTRLLLHEPRKIVWVYSMLTQRMPFGFAVNQTGTMYFKLINGDELTINLPAKELKAISESLNTHLPHATFGYTKEREQWFMAHPAMLLNAQNDKPTNF